MKTQKSDSDVLDGKGLNNNLPKLLSKRHEGKKITKLFYHAQL